MARTEYFIRKDFWTGYYKLTQRTRTSPGEGILAYLILLGVVLLIGMLVALTLPFWLLLFGLSVKREFRFQIGILAIIALSYFYLDIYNHWLSSYFFLGYYDDEGKLVDGLFGFDGLKDFHFFNLTSAIVAIGFIIDSLLYKSSNNKGNYSSEWKMYGTCIFFGFFLSKGLTNRYFNNEDDFIIKKMEKNIYENENSDTITNDVAPLSNNISSNYIQPTLVNDTMINDNVAMEDVNSTIIHDPTRSLNNYFYDVSKNKLEANNYFSDNVYKYITLRDVSPNDINHSFQNDSKEYTNQTFDYDTSTIEYVNEINRIKYYKIYIDFKCFRTSKKLHQKSSMLLMYGLNEDMKISYFNYLKVDNTIYY